QRPRTVLLALPLPLALAASCLHGYPYGGSRVMVFTSPALVLLIAEGIVPTLGWLRGPASVRAKPEGSFVGLFLCPALSRLAILLLVVVLLVTGGRAFQRVVFPWP